MKLIEDPKTFYEYLSGSKKTAVLFELDGCPYCLKFKPMFESFAAKNDKGYEFLNVILGYDSHLWDELDLEAVPSIIIYENGKVKKRIDCKPGIGLNEKDLSGL